MIEDIRVKGERIEKLLEKNKEQLKEIKDRDATIIDKNKMIQKRDVEIEELNFTIRKMQAIIDDNLL
jgi:hypothetical protein